MGEILGWGLGGLCVLAVVALFVGAIVKTSRQRRFNQSILAGQQQLLPQWAAQRGFTYVPQDDRALGISRRPPIGRVDFSTEKQAGVHTLHWAQVSATFEIMRPPEWVRAEHVMNADRSGKQTVAFQYHLHPVANSDTIGEADGPGAQLADRLIGRHVDRKMQEAGEVYRTVIATRLPRDTPFLAVAPKPRGSAVVEGRGLRDMKLEHHGFNRTFLVHSQNDRFSIDVLHQGTMEWMLAEPLLQNANYLSRVGFVFDNGWCYLMGMTPLDAHRLDGQLALLEGFVDRIPGHVWSV